VDDTLGLQGLRTSGRPHKQVEYSRVQFASCIVSLLLAEEFEESFFSYVGSFISLVYII
jgi:hypothetical protein